MIIGEIIQRIQSLYSSGVESDDTRITSRHIWNKLKTVRSRVLSQKLGANEKIGEANYQTLPCVELIPVEQHECPCLPPIGCEILRTKYKVPTILTSNSNYGIYHVTSLDGETVFSEITWVWKKYRSHSKYTSKKPDFFFKDGYMYVTVLKRIKAVIITALFDDPIEAYRFENYCGNLYDCTSNYDFDLPLEYKFIDNTISLSVQELVEIPLKVPEDITNDTRDSDEKNTR